MKIEIEDLKKVKLDPKDILVVSFDVDHITQDELDQTSDALHDVFPRNTLLFNPSCIELKIYSLKEE